MRTGGGPRVTRAGPVARVVSPPGCARDRPEPKSEEPRSRWVALELFSLEPNPGPTAGQAAGRDRMELRARPEAVRVTRSPGPGPRRAAALGQAAPPRGPPGAHPDPEAVPLGSAARVAAGAPWTEAGAAGGDLGAGGAAAAGAAPRGVRRGERGRRRGERRRPAGPRVTRRPGRRAAGRARGVGPASGQAGGRAARTMPSFDEALQQAGEFGRFQRRVFLLLCLTGVTFAFLFVGVVFLGSRPDHYWCRGPSAAALAERCGWSPEEEWNRTAPSRRGPAPPERRGDGRCQRYLLEAANASAAATGALSCADPLAAFPNRSAPLVPCRGGWRYAQAHSTIVSEFDLVCVNAWMLDLTQAILNLGFLAGAFTLGYAADRYGRIVIYLISCFGVGVTGVVVAFAPNFPVFVVFRFLQGVFGKGTWITCYVIVTEIVGSKQRRIVGIAIQMFFTLGIIILPGIAYFIPSWQGIQLAITLPNFLFLLYYWVVPESPRWLITRKKGDKALKILRSIAKCNGKYLSPNYSECRWKEGSII
ncbi:solute carrier family 22 member 3 isoform X3 [Camelus ferus]|uniref:Solute carrier family 22 member 3 isoform X3 n=1 Tax=Camelus ferus TaxID=419612 RepID=A0A8B8TG62_CAMFR|nr:solute carrier family 22 member 3 isoform X3 [Camelus ferus]